MSYLDKAVTVLGAGSWGTALSNHLAASGRKTTLWGRNGDVLAGIKSRGENERYLPGYELSSEILVEPDLLASVSDAQVILVAIPSQQVRELCRSFRDCLKAQVEVVSTAKGLETGSLLRMTEVIEQELGDKVKAAYAFSGPSFAKELVRGLPTAVTLAGPTLEAAEDISGLFHAGSLRVYSSDDRVGVEIGGAVKNVIALAAGVVDGAGMGSNARAALITRGLAELQRLAAALGANPLTLSGLSGIGDLILTATGELSRNRTAGISLGQGKSLDEAVREIGQVVEGVETAPEVLALSKREGVEMPIVEGINAFLKGELDVESAVANLLSRARVPELQFKR